MTKKFVLGLELFEEQDKRRALKTVSTLSGIDEITIDMKGKKLTVVGTVDPITVVSKLRKKNWTANIISVGPKEEPKKEEPKKDEAKKDEAKKDESKKDEAKKEEEGGAKKQSEEGNKKESESPANNKKSDDHHQQQAVNIRVIEPPQFMYGGAPPMPAYRPYYYQQPMHMNPNPNSNFYYVKHHSMEENPNACVIC